MRRFVNSALGRIVRPRFNGLAHSSLRDAALPSLSMDDSVQVKCTRCKSAFRERARRLQNGYSRQCLTCEVVLFFDEESPDANIKRAMRMARRVRRELREAETEFHPRMMSRRGSARHATDDESVD
jgi:hypothetical protein